MKKVTRIACLLSALVLAGISSAGAWPYGGYCYTGCGYSVWTEMGNCCGRQFQCADGSYASSYYWELSPGNGESCLIS